MSGNPDQGDGGSVSGRENPRAFEIEYTEDAWRHLAALRAFERRVVVDAVDAQLRQQPMQVTRNRKQLRPNPLAPWELRVGDLRVFYDVDDVGSKLVVIAIGKKEGNRLLIGGTEVEL